MVYEILPGGGTEAIHKNVATFPDKVEKEIQLKDGTDAIQGEVWPGSNGLKRFGCTEEGYWYHHESTEDGTDPDSKFEHYNMNAPNYVRLNLTEYNNDSYAYLKSVGSKWRYDVNEVHPRLKHKLYRRFDNFDKNDDGNMEMAEVCSWADRMKRLCNASDEECDNLRGAIRAFFGGIGVTDKGLTRDNWVEANQCHGECDRERVRSGEPQLVARISNAYLDVLDEDGDGTVSLEELKTMMIAFDIPEEAAYTFFEKADTDASGKLDRDEMVDLFNKFWFEEYDPALDGIYAYKY
jgi:Ca2+-binding EF-hand superfamily protein